MKLFQASVVVTSFLASILVNDIHIVPHNNNRTKLCPQPPAYSMLLNMTDAQLAYLGLPSKIGRQGDQLVEWYSLLRHAQHRVCQSYRTNIKNTIGERFFNWSGNIAIDNGYSSAHAGFTVPCADYNPSANAYSSHWVGLGGDPYDGGGNLIQVGVAADSGAFITINNHFFNIMRGTKMHLLRMKWPYIHSIVEIVCMQRLIIMIPQ